MIEVIYDKDKEKDKQEFGKKVLTVNRKRENYLRISDRSDRRMDISASIWKIMLLHI